MKKNKLSVVVLVWNEEKNIARCLESVKDIATEIIVFDEHSTDRTVEIAKKYTNKVFVVEHKDNFHINKQKAIEEAKSEWILQLDIDEVVTSSLANEIRSVLSGNHAEFIKKSIGSEEKKSKERLFERHENLIREREGHLGKPTGEIVAFFIPRVNYFLGKPLIHAGVYPDGVIRLFKKGKASLPAKSVHELMEVDGEVGWLFNDLEHHESPTLHRYLSRANRYTDITANELSKNKVRKNAWSMIKYSIMLPTYYFLLLFLRHKGFKDGIRGFLWSAFSALHYPIAYWKYFVEK